MSEPYIGQVQMWGCNFAPRSWAFCNGQSLQISQYTSLYAVIGITYGGDGRANFALPNLAWVNEPVVSVGVGKGPGLSSYIPGQKGGTGYVALTDQQFPEHSHSILGTNNVATLQTAENNYLGAAVQVYTAEVSNELPVSPSAVAYAGGGQIHGNIQPFLGVNFCIALEGLFPTRS